MAAGDFTVSPLEQGGGALASWGAVAGAAGYRIYYGAVSGAYLDSVDATAATLDSYNNMVVVHKYR